MAITKPFTFTAGTKARANEVNQNFDVLYSEVNAIDSSLTNINVEIQSLGEDKANINGNASQRFQVASGINAYDAVNVSQLNKMTPTGSIIMLLTQSVPDGFLLCDGSTVSRTTYKDLFDVIGVTYGAGDGNLTFQLPDFRNRVPWGMDGDTVFGYIEAGLPNITGWLSFYSGLNPSQSNGALRSSSHGGNAGSGAPASGDLEFNASYSNSIYGRSSTVQPPAVKTKFAIKY